MSSQEPRENSENSENSHEFQADFWLKQLSDIDFSLLPDGPSPEQEQDGNGGLALMLRPDNPLNVSFTNGELIKTMLYSLIRYIVANPTGVYSALVMFRLADGRYQALFPAAYSNETLADLSGAAASFLNSLDKEE